MVTNTLDCCLIARGLSKSMHYMVSHLVNALRVRFFFFIFTPIKKSVTQIIKRGIICDL